MNSMRKFLKGPSQEELAVSKKEAIRWFADKHTNGNPVQFTCKLWPGYVNGEFLTSEDLLPEFNRREYKVIALDGLTAVFQRSQL